MEPHRIGPYRIERKLGAGGMGVVYAAWDERLERRVALKQIRPEMAGDPLRRQRFQREARAVAKIEHPSIVRIHDLLETPMGDWLVLQYVDGPTLARRLAEGPLSPAELASLARDVLGALAAAHAHGLLHRDLKAENVAFTSSGRAMVLDFGLAKLYTSDPDAPAGEAALGTAGLIGTYRVMSPEQANGLPLDPRSDLFSLGVLLYEAATGHSPFEAATPVETLTRVCTHLQAPVRDQAPGITESLAALIDDLLEKDVDRRPYSAGAALARIEGGGTADAAPDAEPTIVDSPLRRVGASRGGPSQTRDTLGPSTSAPYRGLRSGPLLLVAGVALLGGLGVGIAWHLRSPARSKAPLYVAVARPEIGLGAGREEVSLAAAALQEAELRSLASLSGVAALAPGRADREEPPPTVQRLARLLAAEEVLTSTLECQARQCRAVLRRQRGSDGTLLGASTSFEVPLDDLHLLDTAASSYLKTLYSGFRSRPGEPPLQVRSEDYQRYLRVERSWEEDRPADLRPLASELAAVRAGSPLFLDAYLLEARIEGHRFFQTRDGKQLEHALGLIAEARRLAPLDPQPLTTLFGVALSAGRLDDAEEALRELEQRSPGDVRTVQQRALLSEQHGNRPKALALLRDAVLRHPSAGMLLALANLEIRTGEIPAARTTLEDLLRRLPGHTGGENMLAQIELEGGSPARAAELYAGLARRGPSFAVLSNLGLSQILLGKYGEAAASLRQAYRLAPLSYAAALNLGDVEFLLGRRPEAEALYRQVLDLVAKDPAPEQWQVLAVKAQAQAHLGRKTEAANTIQRAVVAAPDNPEVAYSASLVYATVGEAHSALANAERALDHGYNRRWFTLPWFDLLRRDPDFRTRVAEGAKGATPRPDSADPAAR